MSNYAEKLCYWYLRLNGFFPLSRFVLHSLNGARTSDCDLLALRPPRVYEEIGGKPQDWDPRLFNLIGADPAEDWIGLIVEVKGGQGAEPNAAASTDQSLRRGLERLGITPSQEGINSLSAFGFARRGRVLVARMVIGRDINQQRCHLGCFQFQLSIAGRFIRDRIRAYEGNKPDDWHFFGDDIMQYIIWDEMYRGEEG